MWFKRIFLAKILLDGTLFKTTFVKYFTETYWTFTQLNFIIFFIFMCASLVSILIKEQKI